MAKNKSGLHPKSKHHGTYNFVELVDCNPELKAYVHMAKSGRLSIPFHDDQAVKALNKALLYKFYNLEYWDIPDGYLCPGVPGRAEYVHHIADLLAVSNNNKNVKPENINGLDIGTGASCIYPIVAAVDYGWSMVGTDIDKTALQSAQEIVSKNSNLSSKIELRLQEEKLSIFKNVIVADDYFDFTMCNPPFFSSAEEAMAASTRKNQNLNPKAPQTKNNFGGTASELWCDGGEYVFIRKMIRESKVYASSCYWFTTLVSNIKHLDPLRSELEKLDCGEIKVVDIVLGNKKTRILCWSFLSVKQQTAWRDLRW